MKKVFKIARNKEVTVNDLLCRADVNTVLADVSKDRANISALVVIYERNDGSLRWDYTHISETYLYGMLEQVKLHTHQNDEANE